jgi:hypothetical protein
MMRLMVLDVIARSASDEAIELCQPSLDCLVEPVAGRASRDRLTGNDANVV